MSENRLVGAASGISPRGRSLVTARRLTMGGPSSKNPYVTDGLVAMWDGRWLRRIGMDAASSLSWSDLTGNNPDIDISTATVESGYVHFNADVDAVCKGFLSDHASFEIVFKINGTANWDNIIVNSAYKLGTVSGSANWKVRPVLYSPYVNGATRWRLEFRDSSNVDTRAGFSISFTSYDTSQKNYVAYNGVLEQKLRNVITYSLDLSEDFVLKKGLYLASLRVYDRTLTEADVAHNYAVDKARFGLA